MFEKEAEEYVMREDVITENDRVPFDNGYGFQIVSFENEVKKGFQDGAEFGYNKAKEEGNIVVEHFEAYGQCRDSRRIADLEAKNAALELIIKKITQHLEPQTMTALFEQVEEEAKQEELLNSTLDENKEIYKKMADLDTALEDCTESLTDARIKIKELEKENTELNKKLFKAEEEYDKMFWNKNEIIFKAKELLKKLYNETRGYINDQGFDIKILAEAEKILKEVEDV